MLRGLILENFKAFGGRRVIPIKPITLIFGPNSAGKSAIIQSLLLLKQTYDLTSNSESGLSMVPKGPLFDFGGFRDFVFRHETDHKIEITPLVDFRHANGEDFSFFGYSNFALPADLIGLGLGVSSKDGPMCKSSILAIQTRLPSRLSRTERLWIEQSKKCSF